MSFKVKMSNTMNDIKWNLDETWKFILGLIILPLVFFKMLVVYPILAILEIRVLEVEEGKVIVRLWVALIVLTAIGSIITNI